MNRIGTKLLAEKKTAIQTSSTDGAGKDLLSLLGGHLLGSFVEPTGS